ncbi:MAG: hypothetical protein AAF360_07575 [Pseudomonadota bacterium]
MDVDIKARMLALAGDRLREVGLTYEYVGAAEAAQARLDGLPKGVSALPHDISENNFFRKKAFWVFFSDAKGNDVGVVSARLDELGEEDVMDYWRRTILNKMPGAGGGAPPVGISGTQIHLGALHFLKPWREPRGHVRASIFIAYMLGALNWPDAEGIYGFVSEKYMMSGSTHEYVFSKHLYVPDALPGAVRLSIVASTIKDLEYHCRLFLKQPELFNAYKDFLKEAPQKSKQPDDLHMIPGGLLAGSA